MKFNKLSIIIASVLCVLANPTIDNNDNEYVIANNNNTDNKTLNKRDDFIDFLKDLILIPYTTPWKCHKDGWEKQDKWGCCKFRCDRIKSDPCKTMCRNYKTEYPACANNCKL
ncbi:hypothetical protein PIROE2DRAFT_13260 [Piromyces sp. E2]|nr:hypothetical protein PIROE2DRAFT_13260 [Piromyces sp. E2]|eukprot:OUM60887.1 hypothetical protein PIROE2DRAFT_13260 [Piromyces sp. E2]